MGKDHNFFGNFSHSAKHSAVHYKVVTVAKVMVDDLFPTVHQSTSGSLEHDRHGIQRALRVLSACMQAVIRATDEVTLLQRLCQLMTEEAAYRMAWVGYVRHDANQTVEPIAWAGHEADYLKTANITWADTAQGQGPTGMVVRSQQPLVCQNLSLDPHANWRDAALERGYQSLLVLPLLDNKLNNRIDDGLVWGVLSIYSAEAAAFDPQEVALLTDLANSLNFGVRTLRSQIAHQQMEQALRLSEEKFAKAFYNSPIPKLITTLAEGRYLDVNRSFEQLFGWSQQELLGRTTLEGQIWQKPEDRQDLIRQLQAQNYLQNYDVSLQNQRGETLFCQVSAELIQVEGKTCILAEIENITQRRQTELALLHLNEALERRVEERTAALRKSEQRYRALMDQASDAILIADTQGNLLEANRKAVALLGYSEEELTHMHASQLHPPEDLERAMQGFIDIEQRKAEYIPEIWVRRKNGDCFPAEITGTVIQLGEETIVWGIFRDITKRKQAEQELQRSNQELGQFAYVASHDLQEPLRAVAGYTQLLMNEYGDRFDETAQSYAEFIVDGAKRMQQLIQDLLAYSRVGTRGKPFGSTDCNQVVQEALRNLQVAIAESHAEITVDPLPTLKGDRSQFVQLFQNLIGNSLKFCEQDHPQIHITCGHRERDFLFQIADNGIGIKAQYLDRIFEVFKRLHTRREYEGTGIGLAICKKIVLRHGGQIWAESTPATPTTPNSGTTFFFTIPEHPHE